MELFNADCMDILPEIKDDIVDLVVVDLPYGQTDYEWDSVIDLKKMWDELKRCCKKKCVYAFFCTTKFGYSLIKSNPAWFAYDIVWEKSNKLGFLSAKKHPLRKHEMIYIFKDQSSNDYHRKHNKELRQYSQNIMEYLDGVKIKEIHKAVGNQGMSHFLSYNGQQFGLPTEKNYIRFTEVYELDKMEGFKTYEEIKAMWGREKNEFVYNPQMTEGKAYSTAERIEDRETPYGVVRNLNINNKGTRYPVSILKVGYDKEKFHPTQKPLELCEWLIKTYSNEGEVVLDFCMGSGSTGVACKNTKRQFIGIEKDDEYYKIAHERCV